VRLAGIGGGIECAKLAPALAAVSGGGARAEDIALVRPHLKRCLSCRARLRSLGAVARVAGSPCPRPAHRHQTSGLPEPIRPKDQRVRGELSSDVADTPRRALSQNLMETTERLLQGLRKRLEAAGISTHGHQGLP
jgi:hypothetical protein